MAKLGKRLKAAVQKVDPQKVYTLQEAVKLLKETAQGTKFDQTVDICMNLNVDTRHSDQQVRGVIGMPNGVGKTIRVAVFAKDAKAEEARKAGAELVGAEDLMEAIQKGEMGFDRCIASPDMMPLVGRLGKVLGPRGLMPNPKLGTVTTDVAGAVKAAKSGQVEFRTEKAGIIHAGIGKASFSPEAIAQNVQAFVTAVQKAKPSGVKASYIRKVGLSSTMGPGIKVDLASITA